MSDNVSQTPATEQGSTRDNALTEAEMDTQLRNLIEQLVQTPPGDDIGDAVIQAEIDAVRQKS